MSLTFRRSGHLLEEQIFLSGEMTNCGKCESRGAAVNYASTAGARRCLEVQAGPEARLGRLVLFSGYFKSSGEEMARKYNPE